MAKKFQVFVSSTFMDLQEERREVTQAILDLGHIPSGMETFPAFDEEQFKYIKRMIDDSDYYIVIIGARYGSMDADGIGYTEKEFDYAKESGKWVLAFVHDKPDEISVAKSDTEANLRAKLERFRNKLQDKRLVKFWNSSDNLKSAVNHIVGCCICSVSASGLDKGRCHRQ